MGKKRKIELNNLIGWGIAIFFGITNIISGQKYKQLQVKVDNSVNKITQYIYNNNYNLPSVIINEIKNIAEASGSTVTFEGDKVTYEGESVKVK